MGFRKQLQVLLVGFGFAALSLAAGTSFTEAWQENSWVMIGFSGLWTMLFGLATVVCMDIWRLQPADSHTLHTLYSQYKAQTIQRLKRPYHMWIIHRLTMDPKKATVDTLMRIIQLTENTDYGRKNNFNEIKSREDFVRMHPLTDYEHYREYINQVINGESNVIFKGRPFYFAKTSGTTGAPKYIPQPLSLAKPYLFMLKDIYDSSSVHLFNLKRTLRFYLFSKVEYLRNVPAGLISMCAPQSPPYNITPALYEKLHQEEASFYVQALFALAECELQHIHGFSSDVMYTFMNFIVQYKESLCTDIECGIIGTVVEIPEDIRQGLSKELKPDPQRAADLWREFEKGNVGLVRRLWPELNFMTMSCSSSFKMSADILSGSFLQGVKTMPQAHGASEGLYGINLDSKPGMGDYFMAVLNPAFMELIPIADVDAKQPRIVFLEEGKLGEEYEMVLTSENGLFRYRTGDVIKIVRFHNKTPIYRLVYRLGVQLAIIYERVPETIIYEVMKLTENILSPGTQLTNFVTTESMALDQIRDHPTAQTYKAHYVVFLTVDTEEAVNVTTFANEFDANLQKVHTLYKHYRHTGQIGLPKVYQATSDAFNNVKRILIGGKSNQQFKFPRVLRKPDCLQVLYKGRMETEEHTEKLCTRTG